MASNTHGGRRGAVLALGLFLGTACGEDIAQDREGADLDLGVERGPEERDLRIAPEPEPISEREVRAELGAIEPGEHLVVRDFQPLLRGIDAARTSWALQWATANARAIAADRPGRASLAFLRRLARAHGRAQVEPGFSTGLPSESECHVGFDNPDVLAALPDQAQATFALDPFYYEPCRTGFIRVEPLKYNHYHLVYEDPTVQCFDENGLMGRGEFGDCEALDDPTAEPRLLGSHHGSEVVRIRYTSGGGLNLPLAFSLQSFANVGGEPVKFRYRKTTGEWFQWNSLAGNTLWLLSPHVDDVDEVLITHADTSLACGTDWVTTGPGGCPFGHPPFFLDDFAIDP
jgi:hypothetical protein